MNISGLIGGLDMHHDDLPYHILRYKVALVEYLVAKIKFSEQFYVDFGGEHFAPLSSEFSNIFFKCAKSSETDKHLFKCCNT